MSGDFSSLGVGSSFGPSLGSGDTLQLTGGGFSSFSFSPPSSLLYSPRVVKAEDSSDSESPRAPGSATTHDVAVTFRAIPESPHSSPVSTPRSEPPKSLLAKALASISAKRVSTPTPSTSAPSTPELSSSSLLGPGSQILGSSLGRTEGVPSPKTEGKRISPPIPIVGKKVPQKSSKGMWEPQERIAPRPPESFKGISLMTESSAGADVSKPKKKEKGARVSSYSASAGIGPQSCAKTPSGGPGRVDAPDEELFDMDIN